MHPTFADLLPVLQRAAALVQPGVELQCDEENEEALRYVLAWSCDHPKFDGDAGKALMLMGHFGTGKTLLMKALAKCLQGTPLYFRIHATHTVTDAYNVEGDSAIRPFLAPVHMLFDDLGSERLGQHFGDRVEVMAKVIEQRYDLFIERSILSHFTTNLTGDDIAKRYGSRAHSRLLHMVNACRVGHAVDANDRRRTAKAPARIVVPTEVERTPADPEIAKAGIQKAFDVIRDVRATLTVAKGPTRPGYVPPDPMQDFAAIIAPMQPPDLIELREKVERRNTPLAAAPYLAMIDARLNEPTGT